MLNSCLLQPFLPGRKQVTNDPEDFDPGNSSTIAHRPFQVEKKALFPDTVWRGTKGLHLFGDLSEGVGSTALWNCCLPPKLSALSHSLPSGCFKATRAHALSPSPAVSLLLSLICASVIFSIERAAKAESGSGKRKRAPALKGKCLDKRKVWRLMKRFNLHCMNLGGSILWWPKEPVFMVGLYYDFDQVWHVHDIPLYSTKLCTAQFFFHLFDPFTTHLKRLDPLSCVLRL